MSIGRAKGFTLLELLVALAVFAMVSLMAYSGLRTVLQSKQQTEQHAVRIQHLQSAILMLERDISQFVSRGIRDDYGDTQPAMRTADLGTILLEFTHAGWRNPTGMARSTLQRVAYGIEEEVLTRFSWTVLDRAQESTPYKVALLDGVREMRLRYLDEAHEWHDQWPPAGLAQGGAVPTPSALEVSLVLEDMGEIRRLFPLLQTSPFASATVSGGGAAQQGKGP
jgi:general secretion pathway protein J